MTEMEPNTLRAVADWLDGRYKEVTPDLLRTIAHGVEVNGPKKEPPTCPGCGGPIATHYGVIFFDGDFDDDHPDPELRGHAPAMALIASGDEESCWDALTEWTAENPLRRGESVEVLARTSVED